MHLSVSSPVTKPALDLTFVKAPMTLFALFLSGADGFTEKEKETNVSRESAESASLMPLRTTEALFVSAS